MLLAVLAIACCALLGAWPSLVLWRTDDADVLAAFPAGEPAEEERPSFELPRDLTPEAVIASVSSAVDVISSMTTPRVPSPGEAALSSLVRRTRRSLLWPMPLVLAVAVDVALLGAGGWAGWVGQAVALTMAFFLDVLLICCSVAMFAVSRSKVSARQRERFVEHWGARLRRRADAIRERHEVGRVRASSSDAPILERSVEDSIMGSRRRLLGTGSSVDRALAEQLLDVLAQTRELEASPHRDGHAEATAQIYAEQVDQAMAAYLELGEPSASDAEQVRSILGVVGKALDREAERLDGKTRLSLDATRRATEALYRQRFGDDPPDGQPRIGS